MRNNTDRQPHSFRRRALAHQRFDVPPTALPLRPGRSSDPNGTGVLDAPSRFSVATEWLGRAAAVLAAVLLILVVLAIHKGRVVRDSADAIITNFEDTNTLFDERADLTAPETIRHQVAELEDILAKLNTSSQVAEDAVAALIPDVHRLASAGQGDSDIAAQLAPVVATLADSTGSINSIATDANLTVTQIDASLSQAIDLVNQLNAELGRTTTKLAPIPAQDALIPAPGGA